MSVCDEEARREGGAAGGHERGQDLAAAPLHGAALPGHRQHRRRRLLPQAVGALQHLHLGHGRSVGLVLGLGGGTSLLRGRGFSTAGLSRGERGERSCWGAGQQNFSVVSEEKRTCATAGTCLLRFWPPARVASGGLCFSRSITKSWLHQDDFSYATLLLFLNIYCEIIGSELSWEAGKPPETLLSKPGKAPRR